MRGDDYERTILHGEDALRHLRENETPAYPQNYELWYTYAAGFNRELNDSVNQHLSRDGRLDPQTAADLHERYFASGRLRQKVGEVSSDVSSRIHEILGILESSERSVGDYGQTLRAASSGLGDAPTQDQARSIIERILVATREIESKNAELEQKLVESRTQIETLHESLEAVRFESLTDQLTGLANRRSFDQKLEDAVGLAASSGRPLCLAICDIDHFKKFNDTFGHQTGDQVLRLVSATIKGYVHGSNAAARYGGEEFALVMIDTDITEATRLLELIRVGVAERELVKKSSGESLGYVTISGGVTSFDRHDTPATLLERADRLLYEAKNSGRNRIVARRAEADAVA